METVARTQTAFRIKNGLLERLKWKAKKANKSLNSYVEDLIEEDVGNEVVFPKLTEEEFEKARDLADRYVLKDCRLPREYEGLDAYETVEMDKKIIEEALYEANNC